MPPEPSLVAAPSRPRRLREMVAAGTRLGRRVDKRVAGLALVAVVGLAAVPVWRAVATHATTASVAVLAATEHVVPVALVSRENLYNEVNYYAEFRPYAEVELHAKVSGYVQEIKVDFGDRVKAGQLLATLEVPELNDELHAAQAAKEKAEADYGDAHLIYTRLLAVEKEHPNLVAQQDLDTAASKDLMTKAALAAAKAEVQKYETLVAYTKITAPFDGVVTRRYADPGTLIQSGTASETQSLPVVRVSDNYRLRLDFPVSVNYVKDIKVGDPVDIRLESLGGRTFTGTITRATDRVDADTRKMTTEIEVPNPQLELVPGMYATVLLKVQQRPQALAIPIEAVPPGQTNSVYVVNDRNEIEDRPVKLGIDTPTRYEVLSGLNQGERVLIGTRSQVKVGEKVEPKLLGSLARE
jgi:RND family efflux transporter MFP subunit